MKQIREKLEKLNLLLGELESVAVAFSGGVDSTFLAAEAVRILGDKAVAVTAYSETLPESERLEAISTAKKIGIKHVLHRISELNSVDFVANTPERCYFCKKERFSVMSRWAQENGYAWVLDGANADDVADYRPGMRAIAEMDNVRSPLLEVGMTKDEIRQLSKEWDLPTWNKQSAACLASRISYGLTLTAKRLKQVEQAEECVKKYCLGQVRVRHHGDLARIEVSLDNISVIADPENAKAITQALKKIGFVYVTLDLAGYRTGSLNQVLKNI